MPPACRLVDPVIAMPAVPTPACGLPAGAVRTHDQGCVFSNSLNVETRMRLSDLSPCGEELRLAQTRLRIC